MANPACGSASAKGDNTGLFVGGDQGAAMVDDVGFGGTPRRASVRRSPSHACPRPGRGHLSRRHPSPPDGGGCRLDLGGIDVLGSGLDELALGADEAERPVGFAPAEIGGAVPALALALKSELRPVPGNQARRSGRAPRFPPLSPSGTSLPASSTMRASTSGDDRPHPAGALQQRIGGIAQSLGLAEAEGFPPPRRVIRPSPSRSRRPNP